MLEAQNSGDVLLATGHVQFLAHTAWELENFSIQGNTYYAASRKTARQLTWLAILDWGMWKVRPTTPISPARQFVQNGCKLSPVTGILLHATGPSVPVLVHAAEHCFWQIGAPQLQKLCVDLGVVPSGPNLYDRVVALLQNILHPLSDDRLQALLQLRQSPSHPFTY